MDRRKQLLPVIRGFELVRHGQPNDRASHHSPRFMLSFKNVDQVRQLTRFLEDRKDMVLLVFLVILFHEELDEFGGVVEDSGADLLLSVEAANTLLIYKETPVKHAMLLHKIFRGSNAFIG